MIDDVPPGARNTDPETSHLAARSVTMRGNSQRVRLLRAHAASEEPHMIDVEAAAAARLNLNVANFWKRCGELRDLGLIEWAVDEDGQRIKYRSPRTNEFCRASKITPAGRLWVRNNTR